jgi:hypothetical protein
MPTERKSLKQSCNKDANYFLIHHKKLEKNIKLLTNYEQTSSFYSPQTPWLS